MAQLKRISLSIWNKMQHSSPWVKFMAGSVFILIGAGLRVWPLDVLEARIAWLTFYPMVMIAALSGGLMVGLFSTILSCLIIYFFWQYLSPVPFIKDDYDVIGMAVFFFNGTLISLVAEAMLRAQKNAKKAKEVSEAANKAKSVFLANMSHELRTPLNSILGFSQIMANSPETPAKHKEFLSIVTRSGNHLLQLINNVLDISKIESGKVALEEKETGLYQIFYEIKSSLSVNASNKNIKFSVEISPEVPPLVWADGVKIKQVLYNLAGNAIKFTSKGEVIIRISVLSKTNTARVTIKAEIEDTGIGIKPGNEKKLFLPFSQITDYSTSDIGTGLGLAICKQYIDQMGGQIGFRSEFGKGSVFFFTIPVKVLKTSDKSNTLSDAVITGIEKQAVRSRILIADDHPENVLLLRNILEPLGADIKEVVNGQDAITLFGQWKPQLVFMDVRMPVLDGKAATRIIRTMEGGQQVKIVALTAHALEEERIEIIKAGFEEVICKPFQPYEIFEALNKYLGVKLKFEEKKTNAPVNVQEFSKACFSHIPAPLLLNLRQSVILLNDKEAIKNLEELKKIDPETTARFSEMISNIRHRELLNILDLILDKK